MALTRIPWRANSIAAVRVMPTTACLLAVYATRPGVPVSPAIDAVLTMAPPPWAFMAAPTCLRPSQTPFRLIAITRSNAASE